MSKTIPDSIKSYKIENETYKLSTITLYTATNTDINEKVLIHIFPKEKLLTNANEVTFMNNQVYLMKILNHKNILQLFEIIETKTHAFLIYEYFNGMKLSDYIIKKKKLTEDESLKIFKEILSALAYLKEMYICNLNINSHNILIDSKNHIKICDFKFGHFYSPKEKSRANFIGDHFSSCPELHSKRPYNPESADIWSTGILLYQMLTGSLPFKSQKDLELIRLIIRGDYSMPNSLSVNMKTLIKGLLETKEEKRFKLNDIFNQQIIKEKKITKASLLQGLNILTTKYPIDEIAINIFKNNLNIEEEILRKNLENNKFNEITSLFKQIISKLTTKGIQNINDLSSNKFIAYIKDNKNLLKEEEQINNIQNYLKKEEEVKKQSEDIAAILLNNENEILKGLQDLKRQYDRAKKGIRPLKRNRSFGHTKNKKKKLFEFEEDKKNNDKNDNNIEKPKIKAVKRNTAIYQDVGQFYLNKENKEEKKNENISEKPEVKVEEGKENNDIKTQETKNEDNKITKEEKKEEQKPIEQNTKKVEKKLPEKEVTMPKKVVPEKKMNFKDQLNAVKLSKIPMKNQIEQKAQKMMMNKPQNAPNLNNKKSAEINNNKKGMMNFKKEDLEKEMNMLKAKKDLKSTSAKLNNDNKKETKPQPQKKNEPKVGGMKNIKEMIEQNLKRQRIMSSDNTKK
jgi:serine/threonine protein kinase